MRTPSSTLRTSDCVACPHQRSTHPIGTGGNTPQAVKRQGVMSHAGTAGHSQARSYDQAEQQGKGARSGSSRPAKAWIARSRW